MGHPSGIFAFSGIAFCQQLVAVCHVIQPKFEDSTGSVEYVGGFYE